MQHFLLKYSFLFWFGGSTYVTIEVLWRGYSHWTMLLLAGFLFIIIGLLNEIWVWETSILLQILISTCLATFLEFIVGYIINIKLGWNVWDYNNVPFNFMGQICLPYTLLWIIISFIAIILDDIIRWKFFNEEKPRYTLF